MKPIRCGWLTPAIFEPPRTRLWYKTQPAFVVAHLAPQRLTHHKQPEFRTAFRVMGGQWYKIPLLGVEPHQLAQAHYHVNEPSSNVNEQQRRTADGEMPSAVQCGARISPAGEARPTFAAQYPNQIPARQQFAKRFSRGRRTYDKPARRNSQPILYFRSQAAP
jgi:hypothetical protein